LEEGPKEGLEGLLEVLAEGELKGRKEEGLLEVLTEGELEGQEGGTCLVEYQLPLEL
jgi:hypothetical protein